jgi:hypothetical protein
MTKRMVLALDNQNSTVAFGPVSTDEQAEELRDLIDELGWTNYGVVPVETPTALRRLVKVH